MKLIISVFMMTITTFMAYHYLNDESLSTFVRVLASIGITMVFLWIADIVISVVILLFVVVKKFFQSKSEDNSD